MWKVRSFAMAGAGLICIAQASAQADGGAASLSPGRPQQACADLGSFAVVDPPGGGRGTLTAQSYTPCADLDGGPQRDSVQIGVDVMVGGQSANTAPLAPSGRMPSGQPSRRWP